MYFNSRGSISQLKGGFFKNSLLHLLIGACCLSISNAPAQATGQATQRPRSVIVLSCTMSGAKASTQTRMLCQALQQKLLQPLPHHVFRMVHELQTVRGRAGDVLVNLNIDNMRPDHVGAHLEWRHGTTDVMQTGPEVTVNTPQTGLTFPNASELAAALLEASPEILTELKN